MAADPLQDFLAYISAVHGRDISRKAFAARMKDQLAANKRYIVTAAGSAVATPAFRLDNFSRPLCFIAPHWGNYAAAFVQCAFALPDTSRFLALRGNRWGEDEDPFWRRVNALSARRVELFHTDRNRNMLPVARRMRQGAHLFVLYDLFAGYGETATIAFFDNRLEIAIGWARLCHLADALVVSIAPVSEDRPAVEILDVVDPRRFPDRGDFLVQCRKVAGRSLELLVAEQPAYWFMWEHWEKYLRLPGRQDRPVAAQGTEASA